MKIAAVVECSPDDANNAYDDLHAIDCGFDLDVIRQTLHLDSRTLSFSCIWPRELASHPALSKVSPKGGRVFIDMTLSLFVAFQDAPIELHHSIACKVRNSRQ